MPKAGIKMFRNLSREFWIGTGFAVLAIGIEIILTVIPMPDWLRATLLLVGGLIVLIGLTMMLYFGVLEPAATVHESKGKGLVLDINAEPYGSSFRTRRFRAGSWLAIVVAALAVASSWMFGHERKLHQQTLASISPVPRIAIPLITPTPTIALSPAIYMECHMISLPIAVPPHSAIHLIGANQRLMKSENWGFSDIENDGDKEMRWPDPKLIKQKMKKLPKDRANMSGIFGYLCNVGNLGPDDALYLKVSLDLNFGNDKDSVRFAPIISPLGAHGAFPFFILNECPIMTFLVWQEIAEVETPNEPQPHAIRLRREYRSPLDQIMMLFPSDIQWIGQTPCK
jgi:hypothetical protein